MHIFYAWKCSAIESDDNWFAAEAIFCCIQNFMTRGACDATWSRDPELRNAIMFVTRGACDATWCRNPELRNAIMFVTVPLLLLNIYKFGMSISYQKGRFHIELYIMLAIIMFFMYIDAFDEIKLRGNYLRIKMKKIEKNISQTLNLGANTLFSCYCY